MNNRALVFGASGQDGSYLCELLVEMGYKVYGFVRRSSVDNTSRLEKVLHSDLFELIEGDITDYFSVYQAMKHVFTDRTCELLCFNLAAQSHVHTSFIQPDWTSKTIYNGTLNILEAIRVVNTRIRFYQASSSEMWGASQGVLYFGSPRGEIYDAPKYMQDEYTIFAPQSPYAVAKVAAHNLCELYRKCYNLYICTGILTNHESPRRGHKFVTKKIVNYIADLYKNKDSSTIQKLKLGNLDAKRDWGHSRDFVYGMFLMIRANKPETYVLSTGETYSVRQFLQSAFSVINIDNWWDYIEIDPTLIRPAEVPYLCGHFGKAYRDLGWSPKVNFQSLVTEMVESAIETKVYV
jgi:GDPmannose 4,6-dehydratase